MDEIILSDRLAKSLSPKCSIRVNNDFEAVHSWLSEYQANPNTYASYKKEARKFLLWCKEQQQTTIAALSKEDFTQYIKWLQAPPKSLVGSSKVHLFKAAQSQKAVRYNIRVINSLINYLVAADYIYKNPLKLIKKIAKFIAPKSHTLEIKARILEDHEFKAVLDTLDELPELSRKQRDFKAQAKLIFSLLYHLGLRVNELSHACWDSFKLVQGRVWFYLIGKGGKPGQIPVNNELLDLIMQYRKYQQKIEDIHQFAPEYILPSSKTGKNLSARRIREIVKAVFKLAAAKFTDAKVQAKLSNASCHDLRHLLASNLDALGLSIIDSKAILRHSSEKTTEIYRNSKEANRHAAIQGNVTGMNKLLAFTEPNHTELKFSLSCRKQDALSFNYFINAVINLHLKKYTIINEFNLDEIKKKFIQQATWCGDLTIRLVLEGKLDKSVLDYLQQVIIRAGEVRNIKIRLC